MDDIDTLLENYLRELGLVTFVENYRQFAEDAARSNLGYDHFLLALAEQEVAQRERSRRIKAAQLPEPKEPADLEFTGLPGQWHLIPESALENDAD